MMAWALVVAPKLRPPAGDAADAACLDGEGDLVEDPFVLGDDNLEPSSPMRAMLPGLWSATTGSDRHHPDGRRSRPRAL